MASRRLSAEQIARLVDEWSSSEDEDFVAPNSPEESEIASSEEDVDALIDEISDLNANSAMQWSHYRGRQKEFEFSGKSGVQIALENPSVLDIFQLFIDDEVIQLMVKETNRYAHQILEANTVTRTSRLAKWHDTCASEMKQFIGLLLWMGLVQLPHLASYWKTNVLYKNSVASSTMSRNRFQILLSMWHFSDNERAEDGDRLAKIGPLLVLLLERFQRVLVPGKKMVIDESMIAWRGRLSFRQYIKGKRHKYGIKLFKLCNVSGYTYNLQIYCGGRDKPEVGQGHRVCRELTQGLRNEGRTLYVDNFYTSVPLAEDFLKEKTHIVGTLRSNRKGLPESVFNAKLKKGDIACKERNDGITVLKWKDKRDVLLLTTKNGPETTEVRSKSRREGPTTITKPTAIVDYNNGKAGIDLSDQLASYAQILRRGMKWYRKIAIELICGTAIVNCLLVYKHFSGRSVTVVQFKENLVTELLQLTTLAIPQPSPDRCIKHVLEERTGHKERTRKACKRCYQLLQSELGRDAARRKVKRVATYCSLCPEEPTLCRECFFESHRAL